jgi:serine/threonine-protein kinase
MSEGHITPERWARVQDLFSLALEETVADRAAFLAAKCGGDTALRDEVASLLEAHERGGPVVDPGEGAPSAVLPIGESIGPYNILESLGEGGMGTVYLAEREGAGFTQRVALKLMRAGFADPLLERRLLSERRILARLEHPGIARLIDGGATAAGQPYFAMEYVEGSTVIDYCDRNRLTVPERLRLFLDICAPVHYAHQQLVVHRDLKPTNIQVNEEGRPKLLDFGIAKLLDPTQGLEGATRTAPWLTPAYASPEQIRGEQVGTPSDIYALGILLYEMVVGRRPYEFSSRSPAEIERVVCEQPPEPPSVAVTRPPPSLLDGSTTGPTADALSQVRRSTPVRLRKLLSGDLDTIVLKALAKEPSRRYASAQQLADDIKRYLDGRPVLARPDTLRYRAGKFVRRHRTSVAAVVLVTVSLIGGILAAAWQARRATEQAAIAQGEAEKAGLVTGLMVDLFRLSDPSETLGDTVTARQILEQGVERIEREFGDQPDVQASVFAEVAQVYMNLGLLPRAEALVRRALGLREELAGPSSLEVAETLGQLGQIQAIQGEQDEAVDLYRRAIAIREERVPAPDTLLAATQSNLAWELRAMDEHEEAAELFNRALAVQRLQLGDDRPEVASTLLGLAATLHDRGSFDEAEALFQAALAPYDTSVGKPHPMAATALLNIGMIRRLRARYAEAEPLLRSALTMRSALYEPDHPRVLEVVHHFGTVLYELGRYAEAERLLADGLDGANRSLGYDHPIAGSLRESLATLLSVTGRFTQAIARYDTSLAVKRERLGGEHPQIVFTLIHSGTPYLHAGRLDEAAARYSEALAMSGPQSVSRLLSLGGLANVAQRRRRFAEADSLYLEALGLAETALREDHRYTLRLRSDRAELLLDRSRVGEATSLLEEVYAAEREALPELHRNRGLTLRRLGAAYLAGGQAERAERVLRRALASHRALPASHREVGMVRSLLEAAIRAQERAEDSP